MEVRLSVTSHVGNFKKNLVSLRPFFEIARIVSPGVGVFTQVLASFPAWHLLVPESVAGCDV